MLFDSISGYKRLIIVKYQLWRKECKVKQVPVWYVER